MRRVHPSAVNSLHAYWHGTIEMMWPEFVTQFVSLWGRHGTFLWTDWSQSGCPRADVSYTSNAKYGSSQLYCLARSRRARFRSIVHIKRYPPADSQENSFEAFTATEMLRCLVLTSSTPWQPLLYFNELYKLLILFPCITSRASQETRSSICRKSIQPTQKSGEEGCIRQNTRIARIYRG